MGLVPLEISDTTGKDSSKADNGGESRLEARAVSPFVIPRIVLLVILAALLAVLVVLAVGVQVIRWHHRRLRNHRLRPLRNVGSRSRWMEPPVKQEGLCRLPVEACRVGQPAGPSAVRAQDDYSPASRGSNHAQRFPGVQKLALASNSGKSSVVHRRCPS